MYLREDKQLYYFIDDHYVDLAWDGDDPHC